MQALWWLANESHMETKRNISPPLLWHHTPSQNEQIKAWWTQQPKALPFIFAKAAKKTAKEWFFLEDFFSEFLLIARLFPLVQDLLPVTPCCAFPASIVTLEIKPVVPQQPVWHLWLEISLPLFIPFFFPPKVLAIV